MTLVVRIYKISMPDTQAKEIILNGEGHKNSMYRQISNIRCTLVGNEIVDRSDVIVASPVGVAPITSSFLT